MMCQFSRCTHLLGLILSTLGNCVFAQLPQDFIAICTNVGGIHRRLYTSWYDFILPTPSYSHKDWSNMTGPSEKTPCPVYILDPPGKNLWSNLRREGGWVGEATESPQNSVYAIRWGISRITSSEITGTSSLSMAGSKHNFCLHGIANCSAHSAITYTLSPCKMPSIVQYSYTTTNWYNHSGLYLQAM